MASKNASLLKEFVAYCEANPDLRFWQALRNWAGIGFLYAQNYGDPARDTFYWTSRNGIEKALND